MNFTFGLNGGEFIASGLKENSAYLYRVVIEDKSGKKNTTLTWNKVTTLDCQQIGNFDTST